MINRSNASISLVSYPSRPEMKTPSPSTYNPWIVWVAANQGPRCDQGGRFLRPRGQEPPSSSVTMTVDTRGGYRAVAGHDSGSRPDCVHARRGRLSRNAARSTVHFPSRRRRGQTLVSENDRS